MSDEREIVSEWQDTRERLVKEQTPEAMREHLRAVFGPSDREIEERESQDA